MVAIEQNTSDTRRGSPVVRYSRALEEVREYVPQVERHPLAVLFNPQAALVAFHPRLDAIVCRPVGGKGEAIPVAAVSKDDTLVSHRDVFDLVTSALGKFEIPAGDVLADLALTEYGERMALSVFLPSRFAFDPGDGHPMALRLEFAARGARKRLRVRTTSR